MGRISTLKRNYDHEGKLISKECSGCHEVKPVSEFSKDKRNTDGLQVKCKECVKKYNQEYYQENKDKIDKHHKKYNQENKDKINKCKRKWSQENSDYVKEKNRKYHQENSDYFKEYSKKYRQENSDYFKEYKKEYRIKQIQETLQQIKIEVESNPEKYNYIENKEIYGIIYLVHNTESDRYYIGQRSIGFNNRYPLGWLYYHRNKELIKEDLQLYGENSFEYTKLFKVAHSQYELDKLEAYYIDYYNSYENGYNETRGNIFTDRGK